MLGRVPDMQADLAKFDSAITGRFPPAKHCGLAKVFIAFANNPPSLGGFLPVNRLFRGF
jgi:hypothetical protein